MIYRYGLENEYDAYIEAVNYTFGFNGVDNGFVQLIPGYYKKPYAPQARNVLAIDDENGNKIVGAVGTMRTELSVAGEPLRIEGIGNVAVHPAARGRNIMKETMRVALRYAIDDGQDLLYLGGLRHRYRHFSFDRLGTRVSILFDEPAIRHSYGAVRKTKFEVSELAENDTAAWDRLYADFAKQPIAAKRPRASLYDYLIAHGNRFFELTENGVHAGYAALRDKTVMEFYIPSVDDADDLVIALYDGLKMKDLVFDLGIHQKDFLYALQNRYECLWTGSVEQISILSYERTVRAFLKLKASKETLPCGEIKIAIDGFAGREALAIYVGNNFVSVTPCDESECTIRLSHFDAMAFFFDPVCPARDTAGDFAKLVFPLPFFISSIEEF